MRESETFAVFVSTRYGALVRAALAITADPADAEDLVQETLERCVDAWKRIEGDPEPYVRTVMVRRNISRWRRRRVVEVATPEGDSWHPSADPRSDVSGAVAERDALAAALAQLSPRQRTAVVLRHVEDRSERETAAMMGCSVGAVKSQAHAGLARLRTLLGDDESSPLPATSLAP